MATRERRTGLRKPKKRLKMWGDPQWGLRLTPRLRVGRVDEELDEKDRRAAGERKSWYLTLTQDTDLLEKLGPVAGVPKKGKTLLLFEDDVVALVRHLDATGLVIPDDRGRLVNGLAFEEKQIQAMLKRSLGPSRRR